MATTTNNNAKKVTRKKPTTTTTASTTVKEKPVVEEVAATPKEELVVKTAPKKETATRSRVTYKETQLSDSDLVTVRNGFHGELVYKNRAGEIWSWDRFGDEQDMELGELRAARNSSRSFFSNNWFMIDDPAVLKYLGVEDYYKDSLTVDEFNTLFDRPNDEVIEKVRNLPEGQKVSLSYIVRRLVRDGEIDSIKLINELEQILGIKLNEVDTIEVPELRTMEGARR